MPLAFDPTPDRGSRGVAPLLVLSEIDALGETLVQMRHIDLYRN